ncbi:CDP-diacylglycerol--serine O-phosphatidyltransferase [Kluyveromyces marxianus]|uniref:CDP-diacylglycerol--serine O-phosphatidyltransferase n=2 Tax=Kluyveromyces marxianus TaxID=4911 RepID=W0T5M1_KLUMD|nr:CDP-diacylglycerol--serine O-phosphatidyltransferase [Kluyveromyces marxianus DMKU3-1042]KAG0684931.1 CDP-diacylglycerol-serine O-phosphatidyltransferase [Kluyveromyces marxianus]QGN14458.1 CDP-diacylglycerol--serine O-phosphatidyltransferase [Kluyveromyces marxianus]BAO38720.1 CDP-diacylglycerol--serine O-phosphatidyltransferase [Kluyveromyces marxianus DMKU3-1042]BAP70264.1 CDP-diacylglycerol-serine O-phosphatidyltransferase [Kluyveromyces marxianus]
MSSHDSDLPKQADASGGKNSSGSVLVSDGEDESFLSRRTPSRRTSSIFSLDTTPLQPPNEIDIKKFTSDDFHFSMIRNLHLADFITLLNGFSGFYSIVSCLRFTLTGKPHYVQRAHFFIVLGIFFDFFDGRVARLRNRSSLMGQELDSLADLISFGVAPASIAFAIGFRSTVDVLFLSFFVLCGLARLARFNVTVAQLPKDVSGKSKFFEGLPIPTTLFLVGVMAFLVHKGLIEDNIPLGIYGSPEWYEFHPAVLLFFIQGCGMISKSLKIPKP